MPPTHTHPARRHRPIVPLAVLAVLLAIVATGCNVRSFGTNISGQLGDGSTTASASLVRMAGTTTFAQVSAGEDHTCGIAEAGTLHCWGEAGRGQLGLGGTTDVTDPTQVGGQTDWIKVSAGAEHTCGIRTAERKLFCWGTNDDGRAAPNAPDGVLATPFDTGLGVGYTDISAGDRHTCAVKDASRLYCWGFNADGRLGAGDTSPIRFARRVTGITWTSVSAGIHTCGIESTGLLRCWGPNRDGQLGVGDRTPSIEPRTVLNGVRWNQVDTGRAHTCGRDDAGRVRCWGDGSEGQLGLGVTDDMVSPVTVSAANRWVDVSAGGDHTCAVRTTATVQCWGRNAEGQLGDGTTTARTVPTSVVGAADLDAVGVTAGGRHTHLVLASEE